MESEWKCQVGVDAYSLIVFQQIEEERFLIAQRAAALDLVVYLECQYVNSLVDEWRNFRSLPLSIS